MIDDHNEDSGSGYWPSISDLFMTLFIVALAIMMCVFFLFKTVLSNKSITDEPEGPIVRTGDGITKKSLIDPINDIRNDALEDGKGYNKEVLEQGRSSGAIVDGLEETSNDVVKEVARLRKELKESDKGPLLEKIAKLEEELEETKDALEESKKKNKAYEDTIALLNNEIKVLNQKLTKAGDDLRGAKGNLEIAKKSLRPTVVINSEKEVYRFDSGSAGLDTEFSEELNGVDFIELQRQISNRTNTPFAVDTIEITGHTDGDPVTKNGNLDQILPRFLSGKEKNITRLVAGSNNDLGLLRALAIKQAWMTFVEKSQKSELKNIDVICFSAGQTEPLLGKLDEPETYKKKEQNFRRIEIRLTRRKD